MTRGCCSACDGQGATHAGPCSDCYGSGCAHPPPVCDDAPAPDDVDDCPHDDFELLPESDTAVCEYCGAETTYDQALAWLLAAFDPNPGTVIAPLGPAGVAALGNATGVRLGSVHA